MKPTSKTESNYKAFLDETKRLSGSYRNERRWLKLRISKARRDVDKKEIDTFKLKWYVEYNRDLNEYEVVRQGFRESRHYYRESAQKHADWLNNKEYVFEED